MTSIPRIAMIMMVMLLAPSSAMSWTVTVVNNSTMYVDVIPNTVTAGGSSGGQDCPTVRVAPNGNAASDCGANNDTCPSGVGVSASNYSSMIASKWCPITANEACGNVTVTLVNGPFGCPEIGSWQKK